MNQYQFQMIPAWTHLSGSNLGTWSLREMNFELIKILESISDDDSKAKNYYKLLAEYTDEEMNIYGDDLLWELIDLLNDTAHLPESCSITLNDGEVSVVPFIDDTYPSYDEAPFDDENQIDINPNGDDVIYVVNCHGNTTCLRWGRESYADTRDKWVFVWDMV